MITINEFWHIDTVSEGLHNIVLRRAQHNKAGEKTEWRTVGYYQSYEHALAALVEKRLLIPDGLQALVDEVSKLRGEIKAALMIIEANASPDRYRLLGAKPMAEVDAEAKAKRKSLSASSAKSGSVGPPTTPGA